MGIKETLANPCRRTAAVLPQGSGDVLFDQDTISSAIKDYRLLALGTELIVDRQGSVAFRRDGPAGCENLSSEIEKVL